MKKNIVEKEYEIVVVGGGLSGLCAALAAARHGASVALVQNRPVLGGNASSEMKMHVCGASCGGEKKNLRETGIIEEILLENRRKNPAKSFHVFDTILWEKAYLQDGLDLYLNTQVTSCRTDGGEGRARIISIGALGLTNEKEYTFSAPYFIDASGDGFLAASAGAEFVFGRESKAAYNEPHAQDAPDNVTLGSTLMFKAVDMGRPVEYIKPEWAYEFSEEDLHMRPHTASATSMEYYNIDSGFWWIELGGDGKLNTLEDAEEIRDELLKVLHGVWDHIKNKGDHGAENYALDWVEALPCKRESRRFICEYVLNENDIINKTHFPDAVAYGGWPMDIHAEGGIWNKDEYPTNFMKFKGCYEIPLRCYVPKGVDNLWVAGRIMGASHLSFGSSRVMATCAIGGQAVGTAAALAAKQKCSPKEILQKKADIQQTLLKDDCYIPNVKNAGPYDLALKAEITASHTAAGYKASDVINGISRIEGENKNCWRSKTNEWLQISFQSRKKIGEIDIKFDTNLSNIRQLQISLDKNIQDLSFDGMPEELVKAYSIEFYIKENIDGKPKSTLIEKIDINDNYQRFRAHKFPEGISADFVRVVPTETYGSEAVTIFEIRVYQ